MASIISAGTTISTALNMSGDTSGILQLATNGTTTAVTINTSQNVGIGTASPATKLDVVNTQSSGTGAVTTVRLNHSGTTAGDGPRLLFTSGASTTGGCAIAGYGTSLNAADMLFYAGGNIERMRLATGSFFYSGASGATTADAVGTITWIANGSGPYMSHNIDAQGSGFTYNIFKRLSTTVGNIQYNGSGVTFTTTSDYRLKENVRPATNVLDRVAKLKPCLFNWKESGAEELGFIAHELQEEFPHAVAGEKDAVEIYTDEDGNEQTRIRPQGIDTSYLVATLTAAIQELKALNDIQSATITALTARIVALETA